MDECELVVVWDGSHGGQDLDLFRKPEFVEPAPIWASRRAMGIEPDMTREKRNVARAAHIYAAMRVKWDTLNAIADRCGLTTDETRTGLRRLLRLKQIEAQPTVVHSAWGHPIHLYRRTPAASKAH